MKDHTFDYEKLCQLLQEIEKEPAVQISTLGRSILGKEIPLLQLGKGKQAVLYVGGMRGTEGATAKLLMDFAAEYLQQLARNATVFEYPMQYLFAERRIYLVPMLNPDGISYAINGIGQENPMRERVLRMNGQSEDFCAWGANARGVDLGRNFDAGFEKNKQNEIQNGINGGAPTGFSGEYPESEPETAALCRFLRFYREELRGVLSFQLGGGEIFCDCDDNLTAKTMSVGRVLSRFTGYRLARPEQLTSIGSLSDWCIRELARPAFTMKCGIEAEKYDLAYEHLRKTLFSFPCIV